MTETRDDTTDIAWMRQLAEEGGRAPMKGAGILMAAGLIYGAASLVHWAIVSDILTLPSSVFNVLWLAATALFLVVVAVISVRIKGTVGVRTTASRGAATVWSAVGWGIFALFTALAIVGSRMGGESVNLLLNLVPSVIMVFYGLGWSVTATLQKSKPLSALAIASFAAAPALALLAGMTVQYLAYGVALCGLMAVPGFLLMRSAKA